MAFCGNCGNQLPEGAIFCGNCGAKQQIPETATAPVYTPPVAPTYAPPAEEDATQLLPPEETPVAPVYAQPEQSFCVPNYSQPEQPVYAQPEPPKKKNIWKILLPIIGGVVLIAIIVVLLLVFSKTHVDSLEILGEDELLLMSDETYRVKYEVYPEEHDDEIFWESSDEDVATVSGNGKITAVGEGICTITVRADSGAEAEITVEVIDEIYVENIMVDTYFLALNVDETYSVSWSVNPSDYTEELSWDSTDPSVAKVNSSGEITAVGEGSCYISLSADSGVSAEIYVEVTALAETDASVCGYWTSYGALLDGEPTSYYGMELFLFEDHTGILSFDGDSIYFEWYFDFDDYEGTYFYDAYYEDGSYFWFTYDYAGEWEGDLDVCLEEGFWIWFE